MQKTLTSQYEVELHSQILKVCHEMELSLHDFSRGCKLFTNYQRFALIVLFQRSGKALRKFVSELKESLWPKWLGLREIPGKSTLHGWLKKWDVSFLRNILATTVVEQESSLMAIDATGFDSWQRSRHYEKRLRDFGLREKYQPYAKVDLLVDTRTRIIHDWVLRVKPRHDTLGAKTMIKRFKQQNVLILADRGYDSEPLHEEAFASGNLLYAPTRDFKVKKVRGRHRRRCSQGLECYHQRNIVESINFSLKSRFRSLRSKLHYMKKREFGWKIITYNLEKLSQSKKALLKFLLRITFCNSA
ncbi:transposase, partial [Candidatus Woesearchaeota archaeon]|nr:transposase [Candidatus Woesearchaeota archaeon]